ncbi:MAG: hypothetical protein GY751_08690 [Bacteroidetes bacterium]|nr:hypothetical protein [Bacteroidota bacterium]
MRILQIAIALMMATPGFSMELMDAFNDAEIEITIQGLDFSESGLNDKEIKIGILNLKGHPVTITADAGFIFGSNEEDVQDMILTEPIDMIASNEYYNELGVNAMCIQSYNKTPRESDNFTPKRYAVGNMRALASFVYDHNYQNMMGQEAMWALSDGHSVYDIAGDAAIANPLRQYVANLTNISFDTSLVDKEIEYIDRRVKEYALYLKFYLHEKNDVKLQVYNHKGEFERDLIYKQNQDPGKYNMRYHLSLFGLLGQKYYVRLYVGEEMRNEFTVYIKES